ncbi:MAG TPA: polyprenyl synthetase, partial [Urbifossiella sp.]|nr:polyprenyl synthetase [Urbifossiella sp.]
MDHALDIPPELPPTKPPKLNTAAFKAVPGTRDLRDRVRAAAQAFVATLDKSKPLTRDGAKDMSERV